MFETLCCCYMYCDGVRNKIFDIKCMTSVNTMGNCLKGSTADDISLLRGSDNVRESSSDQIAPPVYQETLPIQAASPVYHPSPSVTRSATQLTEEEQIKIAKRIGLIQHLPTFPYDGSRKRRECVICMGEFLLLDPIRYLPCMHTYHVACIDDWLMRSFTCPSCMEPVDAALLTSYEPTDGECLDSDSETL